MVTSSYPKYKGDVTTPFIESLATNVAALGHEVYVVAPRHRDLRRAEMEDGVHLRFYRYAPTKELNIWGYAESLRADVEVKKPIYFLIPAVFLSSLFTLLRLTFKKRFDVIHAHWVIPNGPVATLVSRIRRVPLVVSLHGSDIFLAEKSGLLARAADLCFHSADAITACSEDLKQRAIELGAPRAIARVVPYGADLETFAVDKDASDELRRELGFLRDDLIVLGVGRLVYKKGFEFLIRAVPQVLQETTRVRFIIAGDGDLGDELKGLAASLGVTEYVHFPGAVPREKIPLYFGACDLCVAPSVRDKEGNVDGLPNVVLEAMAATKPLVATNVGGLPLAVRDGDNGFLVEEKDPAQLAHAITKLLASRELRERFGKAGRERVERELNWRSIAETFVALYKSVSSHLTV